jgi:hypothetical protein
MSPRAAATLLLLGLIAGLAGCGSSHTTRPGFGSVRVLMTDAPAAYDEVNIVVREVRIHRTGDGDDVWVVVRPDSATTFNLLELRNGVFATLGFATGIPAGSYNQLRLVLGDGSNVVVDGVTQPLTVPSGMQSGIKVNGFFEVPDGGMVEVVLDFDAARSIHSTGNGKNMLHPVLRLAQLALTGTIHGVLDPPVDAQVHAIVGADSVTTVPGADGAFTLVALRDGTYAVGIDVLSGFRDTTLTGVVVTQGHTTELDTIRLSPETP